MFQIFATDLPMTLMPGASREDVIGAIKGFVTACAILYAPFTGIEADDGFIDDDDDFV